ncbi:Thoeris anti-phage system NAD(+) hydrolase ThsA [Bacillus safensis]|uniref:Thoeris anti-phage system NAD(+) hydrolase ThsA n=1 Tax=Bacillus safensis TaxID=561879 RepID=UPI0018CCACC7|nr:Thoeris anti-phage system NAD(+) hydrolase ThsA [Bacillus safensis]
MWKFKELITDKQFLTWAIGILLITIPSCVGTIISFLDLDARSRLIILLMVVALSLVIIIFRFIRLLFLSNITLNLNGSEVEIKKGNIFEVPRNNYKVIAFNEFFDTQVDDVIIARETLNGQYINRYYSEQDISKLDQEIKDDVKLKIEEKNVERPLGGKTTRYTLGSVFKDMDFFLVAFSKFDRENRAHLKLNEYASCMLNVWNEVNTLHASKEVFIPLLGSGITRHVDSDVGVNELLHIMLWTFQISKVKFREPAKVTILLYKDDHKKINFYKLKEFEKNGL